MKNIAAILVLTFILPLLVSHVSAAKSDSAQSQKTAKTEIRDTMLEEREALREKLREGSTDVMQKIAGLHAIRIEKRFTFYYLRLQGILDRLGARITALEGELGESKLAKAKTLLNQSKVKLEEAKTLGALAVSGFQSVEGADLKSQRQEVFAARDQAKLALQAFKDATKLMKDSAREVRIVSESNKPAPSVKPSSAPQASKTPKFSARPNLKTSPIPITPPPVN